MATYFTAARVGMGHSSAADPEGHIVTELGEGEMWTLAWLRHGRGEARA